MAAYRDFYKRSIEDPTGFWTEQARLVDWHKPFAKVLEYDKPPFRSWFKGGRINLCHNAVDRHLGTRASQRRSSGFPPRWTRRAASRMRSCTTR
jgi:propionyl-CoA synthetase